MTPKHYPCVVFFGPEEWHHEGMKYGAQSFLCQTYSDFQQLRSGLLRPCAFSVRAIAYFREEPTTS